MYNAYLPTKRLNVHQDLRRQEQFMVEETRLAKLEEKWPTVEASVKEWFRTKQPPTYTVAGQASRMQPVGAQVEESRGGPTDSSEYRIRLLIRQFSDLVDFTQQAMQNGAWTFARKDLALLDGLASLNWLATPPPPTIPYSRLQPFTDRILHADQDESYRDVALAWLCGWRGPDCPLYWNDKGDWWEQQSGPAIAAFCNLFESPIRDAIIHLQNEVEHFPPWKATELEDHVANFAHFIGTGVATDTCNCGHHVRQCPKELRVSHTCCLPKHRLSHWDPEKASLRGFVREAIVGNAGEAFQAGAFAYGALLPALQDEVKLQVDFVEFKICHRCLVRHQADEPLPLYEGDRCPDRSCDTPFDASKTRRYRRKNWIFVEADDEGTYYEQMYRWECSDAACALPVHTFKHPRPNLYDLHVRGCPLCLKEHPDPPTRLKEGKLPRGCRKVWVWSPPHGRASRPAIEDPNADAFDTRDTESEQIPDAPTDDSRKEEDEDSARETSQTDGQLPNGTAGNHSQ